MSEARPTRIVGTSIPKLDAAAKATGSARYVDDLKLPRMVFGRLLRSPYPHARIVKIDPTRALALPGVLDVLTGKDFARPYGIMPTTQDEHPLTPDTVRYVGEPVAAVCAVDEETAEEALGLVDVRYDPLPVVSTMDEALDPGSVRVHEEARHGNVMKEAHLAFGDVEEALAEADLVAQDTYFYEGSTHAAMEEHACLADCDAEGKLTLWTTTQVPHYVHRLVAEVLEIPPSRLRVVVPTLGGGFGGKGEPFAYDFAACLLALRHHRPVKFTLSREEVFYCHRGRHPMRLTLRTGVRNDGSITGVHLQAVLDGGAYASYGLATTYYSGAVLPVSYRISAYRYDSMRLYTNKPACGPKRGHGMVQPRHALECQLDRIADQLGLDPADYRKRIAIEPHSTTVNGLRVTSCGLVECIDKVVDASGWASRRGRMAPGRGLGLATSGFVSGAGTAIYWNDMPHSAAVVTLDRGGGVTVFCGATDIGQGSDTVLAMVVAEELGVEVADVRICSADTDLTPVDLGSYSSRVTFMAGNAARQAAHKLRRLVLEAAAERLGVPASRLVVFGGFVHVVDEPTTGMSFAEAVQVAEARHGVLSAHGSYTPPKLASGYKGSTVGVSPAYSYSACIAEVLVDLETYQPTVERLWVAHDCGKAINPAAVEGQIEGGALMGVGEALFEAHLLDGGIHRGPSLLDYKVPTIQDTPEVSVFVVETLDEEGPYGAKEAGEGPIAAVVPAIANAVAHATGVRADDVPITPAKIVRALREARRRSGGAATAGARGVEPVGAAHGPAKGQAAR